DARAARLATAQAWHVDDIGVWILLGPPGDGLSPGRMAPVSIALPDRLLAMSWYNGKSGTVHWRRLTGEHGLRWGVGVGNTGDRWTGAADVGWVDRHGMHLAP